ncbi:unnamed protein product [Chrysodeixis includens]|uniref:Uncharacterized protein n=1 Tax=Chrysodeixis includens TaxID=689277 RepID=A0A9P0FSA5_CHRIL|nr:unnamed protein product [Chrysodeixis includens]
MGNTSGKSSPNSLLEFSNNVTTRKRYQINVNTKNSFNSLSENKNDLSFISTRTTRLNRSCSHIQSTEIKTIEELNSLINSLQEKLASAECKIENILIENSSLKKTITNKDKIITNLKTICLPSPKRIRSQNNKNKTVLEHSQEQKQSQNHKTSTPVKYGPSKNKINVEHKVGFPDITVASKGGSLDVQTVAQQTVLDDNEKQKTCSAHQPQNMKHQAKNIVILGFTQFRNLASQLIRSRINNKYDIYNVVGHIYPEALTGMLSNFSETLQLNHEDKLILGAG